MFFCWGHVGLVVLLFLCCFLHLALNLSCCFFVFGFWFLGILGCVFFSGLVFVCFLLSFENGLVSVCLFSFENKTNLFILKDVFLNLLFVSLFLSP